jgi:anaerobic selenocysteine-containing dehydrogenase
MNYGLQRVKGGGNAVRAIACLPALIGAWRHRAGGVLLSSSGQFPVNRTALQRPDLLAGRTPRTINMVTIGDDLLRPASPEFGPAIEALVVYNSNPVAVAPDSARWFRALPAKTCSPWCWSISDRHRRLRRLHPAGDYPAGTLGHPPELRPHRCAAEPPGHCPRGEAKPNTWIFRELAARMGHRRRFS